MSENEWACRDKTCRLAISFECRASEPCGNDHAEWYLTASPAKPREGMRWRERPWCPAAKGSCRRAVLAFVSTTDLPAGVKPYTSLVHWINDQVSGHRVLNAKAHDTATACLLLCVQHSAIPRLRTLLELDVWLVLRNILSPFSKNKLLNLLSFSNSLGFYIQMKVYC